MPLPDPDAARSIDRRVFLAGLAALLTACTRAGRDGGGDAAVPASGVPAGSSSSAAPAAAAPAPTSAGTAATAPAAAAVTATPGPSSTTTAAPVPATPRGPATFVRHGDRTRNEVALTFHTNGDVALVTRLADALRAAAVPATLFVVGEWAAAQPTLMRRLVADGHELANHTWSHQSLADLPRAAMDDEIVRCRDVLAPFAGGPVRYFRPSAIEVPTDEILAAAGAAGYAVSLGYDVDPLDYTDPGASSIVAAVAADVGRGSIVSLHTGHADTIGALPGLLTVLRERGLRPVTCSALLR